MGIERIRTVYNRYAALGNVDVLKSDLRYLSRSPLDLAAMRRVPALTYVGVGEVKVAASEDVPARILMTGLPNINHPGQFLTGELLAAIALANALKATMNAHAADAVEHPGGADNVNFPVATADATNLATLITLVGSLITAYRGHDDDAELVTPTYHEATEAADHSIWAGSAPTDLPGAIEWLNELKVRYNAHDDDVLAHAANSSSGGHEETTADAPLTDGYYRINNADTSMSFATASTFWGSEKASQWYAVLAVATNAGTGFTLKAMPWMRWSSEAGQVITLRNNLNAADIGYGLTTDELVGGQILIVSGASKGLMRPIIHNNNNNTTGGTIEYSGTALVGMVQGDWFVVLPPGTNFRWIGDIFNTSGSSIQRFIQKGNRICWYDAPTLSLPHAATAENIPAFPPLADLAMISNGVLVSLGASNTALVKSPDVNSSYHYLPVSDFGGGNYYLLGFTIMINLQLCKLYSEFVNGATVKCLEYSYPAGLLG